MARNKALDKIKGLHNSIENLKANGLEIPNALSKQVSTKEKEYIKSDVIPRMKALLKELLDGVSTSVKIDVEYTDGKIAISSKSLKTNVSTVDDDSNYDTAHKQQNRSLYSLNGGPYQKKVEFVVGLVEAILDYDPECTYKDLLSLLPKNSSNNRTIISIPEWNEKNEDAQKRYYLKKMFHTKDGVDFYVSTQWTKEAFDKKLLPAVEALGFTWESR